MFNANEHTNKHAIPYITLHISNMHEREGRRTNPNCVELLNSEIHLFHLSLEE
jgi:3-dehydroquinate dehydratase